MDQREDELDVLVDVGEARGGAANQGLQDADRCFLNLGAQLRMQGCAGAEIHITAQGILEEEFQVGQLDEPEGLGRIAIDKDVDVRGVCRVVAGGGAEQIERSRAEGTNVRFGFLDKGNGFVAVHLQIMERLQTICKPVAPRPGFALRDTSTIGPRIGSNATEDEGAGANMTHRWADHLLHTGSLGSLPCHETELMEPP